MAVVQPGTSMGNDAAFNLAKQVRKLSKEAFFDDTLVNALRSYGVMEVHDKLNETGGTTVNLYNLLRHETKGSTGDVDAYSNATTMQYGDRTLSINMLQETVKYPLKGTLAQQYAAFNLDDGVNENLKQATKAFIRASLINQVAGVNATSITVPDLYQTAFSSTDLTKVTGFNSVAAPSSIYKAYGSAAALSNDQSVSSSHPLTYKDLEEAYLNLNKVQAGVPIWDFIKGKSCRVLGIVSSTAMIQLQRDATASGFLIKEIVLNTIAGGKPLPDMKMYDVPMLSMKLIEVPDHEMPRGVHSSTFAEVANTRRAVFLGKGALDVAFGAGYQPAGANPLAGFNILMDDKYKSNNQEVYVTAKCLWGAKKRQIRGTNGTSYDAASYVITHYSAT